MTEQTNETGVTPSSPEGEQPLAAFTVDLTKEEYVLFCTSRVSPQQRRTQRAVAWFSTILMLGMGIFFLVSDWKTQQMVDPLVVLFLVFSLALGWFSLYGMEWLSRRRSAKNYEEGVQQGQRYFGVVRVYPYRVEKETAQMTRVFPLNASTSFLEKENVMALSVPNQPVLILCSRYLGIEEADCLRRVVAERVPERNCRRLSRFVPTRKEPAVLPVFERPAEEEEQWRLRFSYTEQEMKTILRGSLLHRFQQRAPLLSGVALAISCMAALVSGELLFGAGLLVVLTVLLLITNVVLPLRKAETMVEQSTEADRQTTVIFKESTLSLLVMDFPKQEVPWKAVSRAVNSPENITLYVGNSSLLIPKRVIEQEEAFCRMVDTYMAKSREENR